METEGIGDRGEWRQRGVETKGCGYGGEWGQRGVEMEMSGDGGVWRWRGQYPLGLNLPGEIPPGTKLHQENTPMD